MYNAIIKVPISCNYVAIIIVAFTIHLPHAAATTISSEKLEELNVSVSPSCNNVTSNSSLDCSHLGLNAIPKNLPKQIVYFNLSFNSITTLDDEAFESCCENVRVLDLSNNQLANVSRKAFSHLLKIEAIFLDANNLTKLDPEAFMDLKALRKLSLSTNMIDLNGSGDTGFLIQLSVVELNLDLCDIRRIPEKAFNNMSQLENLTLKGNPLDDYLDVSAFRPLQNLLMLRIPNVQKSSVYSLCETIGSIDVILFDEYNISCFLLTSEEGSPFENSIIKNDLLEPIELQAVSHLMTAKQITTTLQPTTSINPNPSTVFVSPSQRTIVPENVAEISTPHPIKTIDGPSMNQTKFDAETAEINISNETIKYILVGIFGVTILSIVIGLVCRTDVCGIKTRICRSSKNRRAPTDTDTVSPFEEIPLNSNGKITEGQG